MLRSLIRVSQRRRLVCSDSFSALRVGISHRFCDGGGGPLRYRSFRSFLVRRRLTGGRCCYFVLRVMLPVRLLFLCW
jgi:hypothetical protein